MPDSGGIIGDPTHPRVEQPQDGPRPVDPGDPDAEFGKTIGENSVKVEYLDTPVKFKNDKKDYRVIKLTNGLTALLISDVRSLISSDEIDKDEDEDEDDYDMCDEFSATDNENVNKKEKELEEEKDERVSGDSINGSIDSAPKYCPEEEMANCSLCVGVGSFSDPDEIPGMANFLGHMLFMGSEKYPEENDFNDFLEEHRGRRKAITGFESTTFSFEVFEKSLLPALDRFAQYFIGPILKRDAMSRQCEVMESEFQTIRTNDSLRAEQILSTLARPGHPAGKLTWGNLVTLRDNFEDDKLYEELHKFRERHYSAHRMTLVIQASLPLETLEEYVKDCFAAVPNNSLPADDFSQFTGIQPFDVMNFRRIHRLKSNADFRKITLTWMMPLMHPLYKCRPQDYVSWVMNHYDKGSLDSYLLEKMWCLYHYTYLEQRSIYTMFHLTFSLTEDGHKHLKDVLDAAFSYITMMRKAGPQQRIHDQMYQVTKNDIKCEDAAVFPAAYNAECLACDMQLYPPNDYITGSQLNPEYNATEIQAFLDALTPDSVHITILDKKFNEEEFEKVEPWFNFKYGDVEIPKDWIEHWKGMESYFEFHSPEPNIFDTYDFSLVPLPEDVPDYPTKIHSDAMCEIWFRPDPKFRKPECFMNYYFISPLNLASPQNSAASDLMVSVLQKLLDKELEPARETILYHKCRAWEKGIIVTLRGFNEKLPVSLATIMRVMVDCPKLISEDMFNTLKAQESNAYYDEFRKPKDLEGEVRWSILSLVRWRVDQRHAAICELDFKQFLTFVTRFVDHIYLKCLVQGNITKEDVIKNTLNCFEILKCRPILPNTLPEDRALQLPLGVHCCRLRNFDKAEADSVVTNYYQSGIRTTEAEAIAESILMLMGAQLSDQLIRQEQLGHSAYCQWLVADGIFGFCITVCTESDKFTTEYIDERIEAFVKSFGDILDRTSEEELSTAKNNLVKHYQCPDLTLKTEHDRNWGEIVYNDYKFDRDSKHVSAINSTTLADLRDWMGMHVLGGSNLRKLSIQIVGHPREEGEIENDLLSAEEKDTVKNTRGSTETSETCVNDNADKRDSSAEHTDAAKYSLEYLTDMPNEKTIKPSDYYITDIQRFKNSLHAFPAHSAFI